jgi:hypothetical protein
MMWWLGLPFRLTLLALLGIYRGTVGQIAGGRCRFHPTCSAYAIEAIHRHGAARGAVLSAWRVLRCSPLTSGGLDPVPQPRRMTPSHGGATGRTTSHNKVAA